MTTKAVDKNELMTVTFSVDGNEVKLSPSIVKEYITGGQELSNQEYKMFVELCKVRKLNPFLREAYAIKYSANQPAQIVVGKDAILKRAIQHEKFNGKKHGVIVITEQGEIVNRTGSFKLPTDTLVGGWATVYRKDWENPTEVTVAFDEVAQKKGNGELNSNWGNKGATMVEKVALVRALRETFVEDLGGMIDADEAWSEPKPKQEIIHQEEPLENEIIDAEVTEQQVSLNDL